MSPFTPPRHRARELVANGALLLDVRTPAELNERHVPGAINISLQNLPSRMTDLGPKDRMVVVYCRSGARSASAASLLTKAGYEVCDIGGMGNW